MSEALAATWYIDKAATGINNGTSWENAWKSFADITWGGGVVAGDTVYISGGSSGKTYNETLNIGTSGSYGSPIIIKTGAAHPTLSSGHNGMVTIDLNDADRSNGVFFGNHNNIVLNGNNGSGEKNITITNSERHGIRAAEAQGCKFLYLIITYCGNSIGGDSGCGISIGGADFGTEVGHCDITHNWRHGIGWTQNIYPATSYAFSGSIHHCRIINNGEDGLNASGGLDFYNNVIGGARSYVNDYSDGIQVYGGYLRFYNNEFYQDVHKPQGAHALLFIELYGNNNRNFDHIQVYNNVFYVSGGAYDAGNYFGFVLKMHDHNLRDTANDILIANNTFVDIPYAWFRFDSNDSSTKWRNVQIKNNLVYNCANISLDNADYGINDVVVDNNAFIGGGSYDGARYSTTFAYNAGTGFSNLSCASSFKDYKQGEGTNSDYHLSSNDSCARGQGIKLSSHFLIDKDGIIRPQSGAWSIGAYEKDSIVDNPKVLRIVD